MATATKSKMTASEFLAWENSLSDVRHEFVEGEVFAMTGTTRQHNRVVINLVGALDRALQGTPCSVFAVDIKVRVEAANAYFYPDLVITCSEKDLDVSGPAVLTEPSVIIEVSAPSTAECDKAGQFVRYCMLPSLNEYAILAPLSDGATVPHLHHCRTTGRAPSADRAPGTPSRLGATADRIRRVPHRRLP